MAAITNSHVYSISSIGCNQVGVDTCGHCSEALSSSPTPPSPSRLAAMPVLGCSYRQGNAGKEGGKGGGGGATELHGGVAQTACPACLMAAGELGHMHIQCPCESGALHCKPAPSFSLRFLHTTN